MRKKVFSYVQVCSFHLSKLNGDECNLVLTVEAKFNLVNHVFLQTSSCWCNIFQACITVYSSLLQGGKAKLSQLILVGSRFQSCSHSHKVLCWISSRMSISFCFQGDHTQRAYSRLGLTKALYRLIRLYLSRYGKDLDICPTSWFAFIAAACF